MRRTLVLTIWLALTLEAAAVMSPNSQNLPRWGVVPGVVIVKLKAQVEPAAGRSPRGALTTGLAVVDRVAADVHATSFERVFPARPLPVQRHLVTTTDPSRLYRFEFDVVRDPAQVAADLAKDPEV